MLKKEYVPRGYSQTNDRFSAVIVWAPDFKNSGKTLQEEFEVLLTAIDSVILKAKVPEAVELLVQSKGEVAASRDLFMANVHRDKEKRRVARKRLQHAYYDLFKKAGELLMPGREIGPDDDI